MSNQKCKHKEYAPTHKSEAEERIEKIRVEVEKALESLGKSKSKREKLARA